MTKFLLMATLPFILPVLFFVGMAVSVVGLLLLLLG